MNYKIQRNILLWTFLFIPIILMILLVIYPFFKMVYFSFTNWDGVLQTYQFIGIKNYKNAFMDPVLWASLKNNAIYALTGIIQNLFALFCAVLLTTKLRGKNFFKTISFIPYVVNITAVAYMFNYLYDYRQGPINISLRLLGLLPVKFLGDPNLAIFSLAFISFWRWFGYTLIIYLAALLSIDPSIYESAQIDRANSVQIFRHVTFPNIINIVELNLFITLSGSLQAFNETLIMTNGGPGNATYTFLYYLIQVYTRFNSYGFAAALSLLLVLLIAVLTILQRKLILRGER